MLHSLGQSVIRNIWCHAYRLHHSLQLIVHVLGWAAQLRDIIAPISATAFSTITSAICGGTIEGNFTIWPFLFTCLIPWSDGDYSFFIDNLYSDAALWKGLNISQRNESWTVVDPQDGFASPVTIFPFLSASMIWVVNLCGHSTFSSSFALNDHFQNTSRGLSVSIGCFFVSGQSPITYYSNL